MQLMILGLTLFVAIHLLPSLQASRVDGWRQGMGNGSVKGLVSLVSLLGIVLIVFGWRSAIPQSVYAPPAALRVPALLLMVASIWLFTLANRPSAIKRVLRHPQLTGLLLWSVAHLMLNGDSRSLTLFGSFAVWSVVEMLAINQRDGLYEAPAAPPASTDVITAVIAVIGFVLLVFAHPWLAGVPAMPMG